MFKQKCDGFMLVKFLRLAHQDFRPGTTTPERSKTSFLPDENALIKCIRTMDSCGAGTKVSSVAVIDTSTSDVGFLLVTK